MSEVVKIAPHVAGKKPVSEKRASGHVQSLSRALSLLNSLAEHPQGLTLSEVAAKVTLPTSTAHRLLTTLQNERYVRFLSSRNLWFVGVQAFEVGSAFVHSRDIISIARPFMRRLMEESGETVNIGVHDAGEVVYLDQVESRNIMRAISGPGGRVPVHCSGIGKVFLAALNERTVAEIVARKGLARETVNTVATMTDLTRDLEQVRRRGYAIDDEEYAIGLRCVASAIYDENGEPIAGLSISGPAARVTDDRLAELGLRVTQRACDITKQLGGRKPAHLLSARERTGD
jgi:IclR family acetate operon transcriptional repressor